LSRLLAILSVVLVGAGLVLMGSNQPTSGERAGWPADAPRTATKVHDPAIAERADGTARSGGVSRPREPLPAPSRPLTLVIHALGIRAPVVPLEASGGTLDPPADVSEVGWWQDGAMPGAARGSVVITGHTVSDGDGVFDYLAHVRTGDLIQLVTEKGVLQYVVRAEASYGRATLAQRAPQLFSRSSASRLVLVTCEDYNGAVYLANHVVVAAPA